MRRRLLALVAAGGSVAALAACTSDSGSGTSSVNDGGMEGSTSSPPSGNTTDGGATTALPGDGGGTEPSDGGAAPEAASIVCDGGTPGEPQSLALAGGVAEIAIDGTSVYWSNRGGCTNDSCDGTVSKVSKCGGATVALATLQPNPAGIGTNGTNAYFSTIGTEVNGIGTSGGGIFQVPVDGGNIATIAQDKGAPRTMAVHGTAVYWGDNTYGLFTQSSTVSPDTLAGSIAADDAAVYWTTSTAIDKFDLAGKAMTSLVTGLSLDIPAGGEPPVVGIALDDANVYWASWSSGTISKVAKTGGTVTILAMGQSNPEGVATDGTNVYWTNGGDGTVAKVSVNGGTPTTMASGQTSPLGIMVDDTSVYWSNAGDQYGAYGGIMKLSPK
jgi:hypothetical protein